ncbi:MAG: hypothetical protein ACI815_001424 [Psychroserpens sp.]|jgi:hypothetical protein
MNLVQNLKNYFKKKDNNQEVGDAPAGICPNCWGKQEWDGEYYKFMKGQNANPSDETYTSFVQNIARNLDKITIKESTYTCETCQIKYESS